MKAIVYHQYGSPEVLRIAEVEKPQPKKNEVLIRVLAVEVTKADCELRSFNFPVKWFWLPLRLALGTTKPRNQILGGYFCGVVEATGDEVSQHQVGQVLFGSAGFKMGAYAEYLCLSEDSSMVCKPENMTAAEAAAVPLGGFNALHYLRNAKIQPGEKVLINGAGGSIGLFAVQIAKSMGAEVTAVDHQSKEAMLRSMEIDHFVDYTTTDFTKEDKTYDVILSMVANNSYSGCISRLNKGGRFLMANPRLFLMLRSVLTTRFTNRTVLFAFAAEKKEELYSLKSMAENNIIRSVIDRVYTPEQVSEAHRRVETEQRIGSVVISLE